MTTAGTDLRLKLYRDMVLVRKFEQQLEAEHKRGHIPGLLHTGVGQEASLAAIAQALQPGDCFFPDHRCHGLCLLAGSPGERLMAEILGRASGVCGGRGGSMHLADAAVGNYGGNVVEGSMMATVLGPALAWQMRGEHHLAAVVIGDGTVGRGEFNESLNLASVWKLPVLYCCLNNQYAISTHVTRAHPTANMSEMAAGYQMPTAMVDGNDVFAAAEAATRAAAHVRAGLGPYFLEFHTWRWQGIFSGEMRPAAEVRVWKEERDPIRLAGQKLVAEGLATSESLAAVQAEVQAQVAGWLATAQQSPAPDPATALEFVYADPEVMAR